MKDYEAIGQFNLVTRANDGQSIRGRLMKALKSLGYKELNLELTINRLTKRGGTAQDETAPAPLTEVEQALLGGKDANVKGNPKGIERTSQGTRPHLRESQSAKEKGKGEVDVKKRKAKESLPTKPKRVGRKPQGKRQKPKVGQTKATKTRTKTGCVRQVRTASPAKSTRGKLGQGRRKAK